MANRRNFSKESRKVKEGNYDNYDKSESYDPINEENIDYEEWTKFISFYRHHI